MRISWDALTRKQSIKNKCKVATNANDTTNEIKDDQTNKNQNERSED